MTSLGTGRSIRVRVLVPLVVLLALSALAWAPVAGGAANLKLPDGVSRDLAYTMYGEQVESANSMDELVNGRMAKFDILDSTVDSDTAEFDLRVTFTNGITRRGVMVLVNAGDTWYLESIKRTGATYGPGYEDQPDIGVLNTMLAEQTKHTDMTQRLVDGEFDTIVVGTPKKGFRSTTIPLTFNGEGKPVKGKATAVKRTQDGRAQWFIVSFQ